jgi:hypothetical protein
MLLNTIHEFDKLLKSFAEVYVDLVKKSEELIA